MSDGRSQAANLKSLCNFPYSNKDEAKRWLDQVQSQDLPEHIRSKVSAMDKKLNKTGKQWQELKPELETLHFECLKIGLDRQALSDIKLDAVIEKVFEMEITKRLKREILTEIENVKESLKDHERNYQGRIHKLKNDIANNDGVIVKLQEKLSKLIAQREKMEARIQFLENEVMNLEETVAGLQKSVSSRDHKIEKILQMHSHRMERVSDEATEMRNKIKKLEKRNEELAKLSVSRIMVGETIKIMIKSIYHYVHPTLHLRVRNSYNPREISDHIETRYYQNPEEQQAAQERWEQMKGDLQWDEDTEDIIQYLIEKRNETAHPLTPPVDKIEFRDALRKMKEDEEIGDDEELVAYNMYKICKRNFEI